MTANNTEPIAVDYLEAGRRLAVSSRTVERLVATGELPHFKVGRLVRIRAVDLERFAAARVSASTMTEIAQ